MPVDSETENPAEIVDNLAAPGTAVANALLDHYDRHARDLPWRVGPARSRGGERPDPYHVWLSEIMLQQTTVAAVAPYFARFTERWPDIGALAKAAEADVLAAWAGLGYYARARNLVKCAQVVATEWDGKFPDTEAGLRALPGIGEYTAAAIAAIAFGRHAVVVDANVERVVARLFAIDRPLPRARAAIRAAAETITPPDRTGDFAQAMMDLGSGICTARNPSCLICPLAGHCQGLASGDPAAFPVKPAKRVKPVRHGTAWWIERDGHVWLVTRPPRGMLGGMRALPDNGWSARGDGAASAPLPGPWHALNTTVEHGFTHFTVHLRLSLYRGDDFDMVPRPGQWWPVEALDAAGLPTVFARAAKLAVAAAKPAE